VNACFAVPGYIYSNLARNKVASQISTYTYAVASRATDGDQSTESCTNQGENHPWLSIDLGAVYDVGSVTITHDTNPGFGNHLALSINSRIK